MDSFERLKQALEQLKIVFPSMVENIKIAPFLKIHEDGDKKDTN